MFLQWCRDGLVLSFIFVQRFRFVGQDAASKRHHCRNTNVAGNFTDMKYDPPIEKRTTEQLMEIVEFPDEWQSDLVESTRTELLKRGVTLKTQETRRKSKISYRKRIETIKSRATYTTFEKFLIVLLGPALAIFLRRLSLFQPGDGFKKKNNQGLFYLLLGFILWGLTFYIITR
jgi:hypothetical protein